MPEYRKLSEREIEKMSTTASKKLIGEMEIEYIIAYRAPVFDMSGETLGDRLDRLREDGSAEVLHVRLVKPKKRAS